MRQSWPNQRGSNSLSTSWVCCSWVRKKNIVSTSFLELLLFLLGRKKWNIFKIVRLFQVINTILRKFFKFHNSKNMYSSWLLSVFFFIRDSYDIINFLFVIVWFFFTFRWERINLLLYYYENKYWQTKEAMCLTLLDDDGHGHVRSNNFPSF
jgi:hypothetical protein